MGGILVRLVRPFEAAVQVAARAILAGAAGQNPGREFYVSTSPVVDPDASEWLRPCGNAR